MLTYGRIFIFALFAFWNVTMAAFAAETNAEIPFIVDVMGMDAKELQKRLPSGVVISVLQTRDGYLWLGTLNGLVCFDGNRFKVFDASNTPGLPNDRIVHLFEDSRGWLWAGTEGGGIAVIRNGVVGSVGFGAGSSAGKVMATCEDSDGGIWFYTADGQIGRFHGDGLAVIGRSQPSFCRALIAERSGRIWVGTDREQFAIAKVTGTNGPGYAPVSELKAEKLDLLLASGGGGFWRLADGRIEKWGADKMDRVLAKYAWTNSESIYVTSACEDLSGNLIVGVRNMGVFWFDATGRFTRISTGASVLSVCMDREGDLWLGTDGGGLNRVKRGVAVVAAETQGKVVQSICEDTNGALWIGFTSGGVMGWKDGVSTKFGWDGVFRPEDGLVSPNVLSVFADKSGQIWAGTREPGGLHQFRDGNFQRIQVAGIVGQEVIAMHQDRTGRIWVGTPNGIACWDGKEWKAFTPQNGLSGNVVRAIADDAAGNLWIGTLGDGLNCLRDGKFTVYRKSADGLPGDNVSSLLVDSEGVLWVGTSSGLARFKGGKWARFTTSAGLPSNKISYLTEDAEGFLWIGSNAGLLRVAKKSLDEFAAGRVPVISCRAYDETDGLPTSECSDGSQPAFLRTRSGKLWFATIKGLVGIDPSLLKRNTNPPPVIIESVLVDGRRQNTNGLRGALPERITLSPQDERLEFQFTGLNFAAPERMLFRHRLEGYESSLSEPRPLGPAIFTKVPPGDYLFRVIACNEDGVWNDKGATMAITVLPPFWKKGWFVAVCGLGLLGMIVGTVYFISTQKLQRQLVQLRQKEALERERSRIARDLHDQLGANLTRVSLLGELVESDKDQPAEVESHARQISKTASETAHALDEIVWAANPANDTLEGLVNYLCKYAQEFLTTAGLRCRLDVPTHLPATAIAPDFRHNVFLVAKEAVNNVVKHAKASEVRFQIKLDGGQLCLEIEDDGRGPAEAATAGERGRNGLHNMNRRMEDVGGSFRISPGKERGTLVKLKAPVRNV